MWTVIVCFFVSFAMGYGTGRYASMKVTAYLRSRVIALLARQLEVERDLEGERKKRREVDTLPDLNKCDSDAVTLPSIPVPGFRDE